VYENRWEDSLVALVTDLGNGEVTCCAVRLERARIRVRGRRPPPVDNEDAEHRFERLPLPPAAMINILASRR
jgi:hypothetical protein